MEVESQNEPEDYSSSMKASQSKNNCFHPKHRKFCIILSVVTGLIIIVVVILLVLFAEHRDICGTGCSPFFVTTIEWQNSTKQLKLIGISRLLSNYCVIDPPKISNNLTLCEDNCYEAYNTSTFCILYSPANVTTPCFCSLYRNSSFHVHCINETKLFTGANFQMWIPEQHVVYYNWKEERKETKKRTICTFFVKVLCFLFFVFFLKCREMFMTNQGSKDLKFKKIPGIIWLPAIFLHLNLLILNYQQSLS